MLQRLTIQNYAIIDRVEIDFCKQLNIITGETGAGKSILLGALGLILGDRADTKVLYQAADKCVVEAHFQIAEYGLKNFFTANELDYEERTIVRREINQSGKSRAFVNDTPVNLTLLRDLGEKLISLHSQHESLDLTKADFQLGVVDSLAKNQSELVEYRQKLSDYKQIQQKLDDLTTQHRQATQETDYLAFQLTELQTLNLKPGEQQQLENEQQTLSHVESIKLALENTLHLISNGENTLLDQLNEVLAQLKSTRTLNQQIAALDERLHSAYEELKDIGNELENIQEHTALDPERLQEVNDRLDAIYRLQTKHQVETVDALLTLQLNLEQRIASIGNDAGEIEKLKQSLIVQQQELLHLAGHLHQSRMKIIPGMEQQVTKLLTGVGMPNASFQINIQKLSDGHLGADGLTEIHFLFSANKGYAPMEIKEIASGGELSRLMLCIKSLLADSETMPTMIFDEIDAGISGAVALKAGELMKKLSRRHQLIAITHLPQIARSADLHLYIYKETKGDKDYTRIRVLDGEERVREIAKMLSGEQPTEAALSNARELITG